MSLVDAFRHRVRTLLRRGAFDHEMDEEFRHHLELQAQEVADRSGADAQSRFGSRAYYMEETRRMTPLHWLDALSQDLRYAWRNLRRTPAFTAVAVLSLAIGIGANSAVFGLLYALLLQPLPVSHPEQLVAVQHIGQGGSSPLFSYDEYQALKRSPGFTNVTALAGAHSASIAVGELRRSIDVDAVAGNFFSTIGLGPLRGRLIDPDDERIRAPVVVISEDLWEGLFNRAPTAIGSTITMEATAFTVIGVLPRSFHGVAYSGSFQAAVPLSTLALLGAPPAEIGGANSATLQIIGRLADHADVRVVAGMIATAYQSCCGETRGAIGSVTAPSIGLANIEHGIPSSKFDVSATFGRLLLELMGGAAIVLLAACVNIGTLLLARASARERELAVRLSLGASRRRLAGQLLVESALLATVGAAAGLVMADWALRAIAHNLPAEFSPIADRVGLQFNAAILGFTGGAAVVSLLIFGVVPAWRATGTDLTTPLKTGGQAATGRRRGLLDRSVVIVQVAIALTLLNAAGLLVATLRNLRNVNGEFANERRVSIELDARDTPYESAGLLPLADRLTNRVALVPGVRSAALSATVPVFGGRRFDRNVTIDGYSPSPDENMVVWLNAVTPGYFATLGIGVSRGRDFSRNDQPGSQQVAIVNEAFVHQYLRGRDPVGATIHSTSGADTIAAQVVAVVHDARYASLREPALPMMYVPLAQFARLPRLGQKLNITVNTAGDDAATPSALRSAVLGETPGIHVGGTMTIEASLNAALTREILTAELAALFGAVALILAAIGLYGIVSYNVAQRTREIGVRMALGAASWSVVWLVLRQALALVTVGVAVGAPLALAGGKVIGAELFGLAGQNPVFVLGSAALLVGVAVASSALPARRASSVDPLLALRAE